jgi:hypothetical protein
VRKKRWVRLFGLGALGAADIDGSDMQPNEGVEKVRKGLFRRSCARSPVFLFYQEQCPCNAREPLLRDERD